MILATVVHRHKHLTMLNKSITIPLPLDMILATVVHRHKHLTMLNQSIIFPSSRHDSCYSRTQTQTFDNVKQVNNIPFL